MGLPLLFCFCFLPLGNVAGAHSFICEIIEAWEKSHDALWLRIRGECIKGQKLVALICDQFLPLEMCLDQKNYGEGKKSDVGLERWPVLQVEGIELSSHGGLQVQGVCREELVADVKQVFFKLFWTSVSPQNSHRQNVWISNISPYMSKILGRKWSSTKLAKMMGAIQKLRVGEGAVGERYE